MVEGERDKFDAMRAATVALAWIIARPSVTAPIASATSVAQLESLAAHNSYHLGRIVLLRNASVISYGAQADAVVTTARRDADADASDQVLVVFEKKNYSLEKTGSWDTLGMRGTCSAGFSLKAVGTPEQILPVPYGVIHSQTMVPASHLMWAGNWAGIAAGAVEKARKFMRKAQRAGSLPPGLVLSSAGALSGTPTAPGSYSFTVIAQFGSDG